MKENGNVPVRDFLYLPNPKLRAKAFSDMELLKKLGTELREPYVKPIKGKNGHVASFATCPSMQSKNFLRAYLASSHTTSDSTKPFFSFFFTINRIQKPLVNTRIDTSQPARNSAHTA